MSNRYDKMEDYVSSIYNVFHLVNRKAEQQKDKRMKMIGLCILNYVRFMAKEYNMNLQSIVITEKINLIPVFEYISTNNIELFDFTNINMDDVDVTRRDDLERFILTHIYYITQSK